jgi:hypothetical protein
MTALECQIMFHDKIESVDRRFFDVMRPTSFEVMDLLNKAIDRMLRDRYLNHPTQDARVGAILADEDALHRLMVVDDMVQGDTLSGFPEWAIAKRYMLPDDLMVSVSLSCEYDRSALPTVSSSPVVISEFHNFERLGSIISHSADKPIFIKPVAFFEDEFHIILVGDAYTTDIDNVKLRYMREPNELSLDFVILEADTVGDNLNISSITNGVDFRSLRRGEYYNSDPTLIPIYPGKSYPKIVGQDTILGSNFPTWKQKVGWPAGQCQEPELPEYMHEQVVDLASQIFLEEGKLKLTPKQQTA